MNAGPHSFDEQQVAVTCMNLTEGIQNRIPQQQNEAETLTTLRNYLRALQQCLGPIKNNTTLPPNQTKATRRQWLDEANANVQLSYPNAQLDNETAGLVVTLVNNVIGLIAMLA